MTVRIRTTPPRLNIFTRNQTMDLLRKVCPLQVFYSILLRLMVQSVRVRRASVSPSQHLHRMALSPFSLCTFNCQVSNKPLRSDIIREVAALCLLGRLDPEGLEVQGLDGPPEGQTVHLVVQVSNPQESVRPPVKASGGASRRIALSDAFMVTYRFRRNLTSTWCVGMSV